MNADPDVPHLRLEQAFVAIEWHGAVRVDAHRKRLGGVVDDVVDVASNQRLPSGEVEPGHAHLVDAIHTPVDFFRAKFVLRAQPRRHRIDTGDCSGG